jgi:hypothetical protein
VKDKEKGIIAIRWALRLVTECQGAIDASVEVAEKYLSLGNDEAARAVLYNIHNIAAVARDTCSRLERILEADC